MGQVIRFSFERTVQLGASLRAAWVNGQPGVLVRDADGDLIAVIVLDVLDGQVLAIRTVANPEKLRHLGPISRAWHQRWGAEEEKAEVSRPPEWLRLRGHRDTRRRKGKQSCESSSRGQPG